MADPTIKGIAKAPRFPLLGDINQWTPWFKWFERLYVSFPRVKTYTVTIDVTSVAANSESIQTVTVTGLDATDIVTVNKQSNTTGLDLVQWWASSDTLHLKYRNQTGSPIDPASEDYLVSALRL